MQIAKFIGEVEGAEAGTNADVAAWAEVLVFACKGEVSVYDSVIASAGGADAFKGKVVVDAGNPLTFETGAPELSLSGKTSLGQVVQEKLPEARVVKCYNSIGNAYMVDPTPIEGGLLPDMWICGNDDEAKATTTELLVSSGWPKTNVIDAGAIEHSALLEPLCILWVNFGIKYGTWTHGFRLLRGEGQGPK